MVELCGIAYQIAFKSLVGETPSGFVGIILQGLFLTKFKGLKVSVECGLENCEIFTVALPRLIGEKWGARGRVTTVVYNVLKQETGIFAIKV